jgi:soluble lytic murein transglycosylase-like protein
LAQLLLRRNDMIHKLIKTIPMLLLLSTATMAQVGRELRPSLKERARELEPLIRESARRYGIDARILGLICFVESRYRTDAISPKGARGLMQFMPEAAAKYGLQNPNDPKQAIDAAAHYLRDLLNKFGGRLDLAVAAYNAGEGAVDSFRTGRPLAMRNGKVINARGIVTGGIPPYPETRAYVKQIMLWGARPVEPTSFLFQSRKNEAIKHRDFTIDTNASGAAGEIKNMRVVNSSFIEINDEL